MAYGRSQSTDITNLSPEREMTTVPRAVNDSFHKKNKRSYRKKKSQSPVPIYSKNELLQMILDNEHKSALLKNASPMIGVNEQIYGTVNTHLKNKSGLGSIPLGAINDSAEAQYAKEEHLKTRNMIKSMTEGDGHAALHAVNTRTSLMTDSKLSYDHHRMKQSHKLAISPSNSIETDQIAISPRKDNTGILKG